MQRLGGRLQEVFAYEGRTARAKFLSQPGMGWYISSKKDNESYFLVPITGGFIDSIISYSMRQFIYKSALINWWLKNFSCVRDVFTEMSLKRLTNQNL